MWRVYAWGLEAVQDWVGALESGRDVLSARQRISKLDGHDAIKSQNLLCPIWARFVNGKKSLRQSTVHLNMAVFHRIEVRVPTRIFKVSLNIHLILRDNQCKSISDIKLRSNQITQINRH